MTKRNSNVTTHLTQREMKCHDSSIRKVKSVLCCSHNHLSRPDISRAYILSCRQYTSQFKGHDYANWARSKIAVALMHHQVRASSLHLYFAQAMFLFQDIDQLTFNLPDINVQVCAKAWREIFAIPQTTYYRWLSQARTGFVVSTSELITPRQSDMMNGAKFFLQDFFKTFADSMPNSPFKHLPCIMLKKDVAERYKRWCVANSRKACSEVYHCLQIALITDHLAEA
jgi:hypothetical protein